MSEEVEKRKTPKLRFPQFTEDWEQRKLGDIAKYRNGKAHENDIDDNGKYIVVNSKFVSTDGEVKKYSNTQIEPLMKDEIAFVLSDVPNGRAIARTFLVDESDKYTLNQRVAGITPLEKTYPYFLHILMNRNRYFLSFDDGAKQTNLSVADVMNFEEMYPSYDEQKIIGDYFNNLDNLITLQQCKCNELKEYKKGMLQKMFPKEGEKKPEVRFSGFTDPWEQRKLGDIATYKNGRGHEDNQSDEGTYELINLNSISIDGGLKPSGKYIEDGSDTLLENDLVMVLSDVGHGDLLGRVAIIPENNRFVLNQRVALLRINDDTNPYFLFSIINRHQDYFKKLGTGSSQLNISRGTVEDFVVDYPCQDEQRKIAKCFQNLDNLITLHQRKLDAMRQYKKGLLQQMFI